MREGEGSADRCDVCLPRTLPLTSLIPLPAAAGPRYSVIRTEISTRTALMTEYRRKEARYPELCMTESVAQNLNPAIFSTARLTMNAAEAVMAPTTRRTSHLMDSSVTDPRGVLAADAERYTAKAHKG